MSFICSLLFDFQVIYIHENVNMCFNYKFTQNIKFIKIKKIPSDVRFVVDKNNKSGYCYCNCKLHIICIHFESIAASRFKWIYVCISWILACIHFL